MKDHWTHYLPEGKRIFRDEVEKIFSLQNRLESIWLELDEVQANINLKEVEIQNLVYQKEYSKEEIQKAKAEFLNIGIDSNPLRKKYFKE